MVTNLCQPEISIPPGGPPWNLSLASAAVRRRESLWRFLRNFSGEVDIVAVRDLLKAGEPVLLGVWSLSEAVHNVDDFVVCDARAIE